MLFAFPILWAAGTLAGWLYAQARGIPWHTAALALPAMLVEISFYYSLGSERLRTRLEKLPPAGLALGLTAAAVIPYLLAALPFGTFRWQALAILTALAAGASFWYVIFPHRALADIFFLVAMAAVWLTKVISHQYTDPVPKLQLTVLGQLMWFRTGLFSILSVRRSRNIGFGFWPQASEWKIGTLYFAGLLPVAAGLGWMLGFARPHLRYQGWEKLPLATVGTFFGVLWVLALGEEFFFRGLLQQWLQEWLNNRWAALILASAIFGSAHLWYQSFPNWRFAVLAGVAGIFYGLAFRQAGSIRASMVTHALTVTTWRIFFF
jgi:membrane protease YdiL (CAAX protease family)